MVALEVIDPDQFANDAERFQTKETLRKLLVRMETPFKRTWSLSFENPALIAGLRLVIILGFWKKWTAVYEKDGKAELTLNDIVELCGRRPEPNLLREFAIRLMVPEMMMW